MYTTFKKNNGLTLIELLVAMVISAILIAALYRTFIGQHKTYAIQEQVVDMQQNVRVAINKMMREIRMAGFGNVSDVLPVTFGKNVFENVLNPDTPVPGSITILSAIGESTTIIGFPARNQITVSKLKDDQGNSLFDTDKKKYISIGGLESRTIDNISDKTITLNGNLAYNHPINIPVFPIRAISYQVVNEVVDGNTVPILKRDENIGGGRQPLAENIESIQFEYFDANGNQTVIPANIRMVKVTITAKTSMEDPDLKKVGDGYRRRRITSNIQLRNMGLNY